MSKKQTADWAFRFASFAFELAREFDSSNCCRAHYRESFTLALALVRHSNHLLALAQEEAETLNLHDPLAVRDFEANWQQGLGWWGKLVAEFRENQDAYTRDRMERHMEAFRAT